MIIDLKDVKVWFDKNDSVWYMELTYEYEDNRGKHRCIIPKAEFPIFQHKNPILPNQSNGVPYIECYDRSYLREKDVIDPRNGNIYNHVYFVDILMEPKIRKMTIGQIENELGYKIEIISGKGV